MQSRPGLEAYAGEICDHFRLGSLAATPTLAGRGQQGLVWHVRTEQGAFAVKDLLVRTDEAAVRVDAAFAATIADRGDVVVIPLPRRSPAGAVLFELNGHQVRVSTWVDLAGPVGRLDPRTVSGLMALLHRDPLPAEGPVDLWYRAPVGAAEWDRAASALSRAEAPFATEFTEFAAAQLDLEQLLTEPTDLQLCHRDLWLDNLPLTRDGRICILDWDNCGPADPGHELAMPLYSSSAGRTPPMRAPSSRRTRTAAAPVCCRGPAASRW